MFQVNGEARVHEKNKKEGRIERILRKKEHIKKHQIQPGCRSTKN
jgi:hypothetical protein